MHSIKHVMNKSIAYKNGILAGESLVSVNGKEIADKLDYMFMTSDPYFSVEIKKLNGEIVQYEIENENYEDLGLVFETSLMDKPKSCVNKCIFCFIDQLPKGMRKTLYFKDDDSRLSFLLGNYITLTNLSEYDIDRIISLNISPVKVSVHTTNPQLRIKMLGNKGAGSLLACMKKLADAGIYMDTQVVLCKDINDGDALDQTISDLAQMHPYVSSLSVVPVGLTKFRDCLYPLAPFGKEDSKQVIDKINEWQDKCRKKLGCRFVYPADEFFVVSNTQIPNSDYYEDFPQLDNGVGLIASLRDELEAALANTKKITINKTISIATGVAAYEFICRISALLEQHFSGLKINVYQITNNFFGDFVTVSGLICGCDLVAQLKGLDLGAELLIPSSMLRSGDDVFLDDMRVLDIENALNAKVFPVNIDGYDFVNKIMN